MYRFWIVHGISDEIVGKTERCGPWALPETANYDQKGAVGRVQF